ncbi:hypothetical protein AQUSIP_17380 [Aquicella siphonis]|uniref:AB hydrolase-1 domain-containing protein n=1 Tax=Aquicella siphonis TaxID=254247 RepID=A0A5E4PIN0_9COXI|nr:alpha/beta hydrolase [Aquicella siphonis]VVC76425.1 hypothetical protein AQUSIP_17380 [Aquicella siphonis]
MFPRETRMSLTPIKGAVTHSMSWLTSSFVDVVYRNPRYNADLSPDESLSIWCVHGTADRNSSFRGVAESLQNDLAENVYAIYLPAFDSRYTGKGIEHFAMQLTDKILASKIPNVVLMGHSRGGLVISYLAAFLAAECGLNVKVVYAIGTPFGGSDKAGGFLSWISQSVRQMEINSDFLEELVRKIKSTQTPHVFFAALQDALVPLYSAHVPGQHDKCIVLPDDGHLSMMNSPELISQLRYHLSLMNIIVLPARPDECIIDASVNSEKSYSVFDEEDEEYVIVSGSEALTMRDACNELSAYTEKMKLKKHMWSAAAKIQILEILQARLGRIYQGGEREEYPEAVSVGDYIAAFLQDTAVMGGAKPIDALNAPLNFPVSLLTSSNADTQIFIMGLMSRYQNVLLPAVSRGMEMKRTNGSC